MKKLKLLVIATLLLAFFAGNALAAPAYGVLTTPGTQNIVPGPVPVATGETVSYGLAWHDFQNAPVTNCKVYYFLSDSINTYNTQYGTFEFYAKPVPGTGALENQLKVTVIQPTTSDHLMTVNSLTPVSGWPTSPFWFDSGNPRITLTLPSSGVAQGATWNLVKSSSTNPNGFEDLKANFVTDGQTPVKEGFVHAGTLTYTAYNRVPEFPTVALPVAAILGLIFVFGRRKGDL